MEIRADHLDELIECSAEEVIGTLDLFDTGVSPRSGDVCRRCWGPEGILFADDEVLPALIGAGGHVSYFDDSERGSDRKPGIDSVVCCGESEVSAEGPPDEPNGRGRSLSDGVLDR